MNRIRLIIAAAGIALIPAFIFGAETKKLPDYQINLHGETLTARPRAQDDFYEYVNYDWFRSTKLPADKIRYGSFDIVQNVVDTQISDITTDAIAHTKAGTASPYEKNVAALYESITDRKSREAAGLGKLSEYLKQIEQVKTVQEYAETIAHCSAEIGLNGFIGGFSITQNPDDGKRYVVFMDTPHTLQSRELIENPENEPTLALMSRHIADLLMLYGKDAATAQRESEEIFTFLKNITLHSLHAYDAMQPNARKKLDISGMHNLYTSVDIDKVLAAGGISPADGVNEWYISDPELIAYYDKQNTPQNLPVIKEATIFYMLDNYGEYTTSAYEKLEIDYNSELTNSEPEPEDKRDKDTCCSLAGDMYERLYAKRYYDEATGKRIKKYVKQVISYYKKLIAGIDWMDSATKKKALLKLNTMTVNVGYSKNYLPVIDQMHFTAPSEGGNLIDNLFIQTSLIRSYLRQQYNKPVDHRVAPISALDVNAYYNWNTNSINFPAAILQKPFFDKDADDITNLGAIGTIIGHEITHSFDSLGSQYDEKGALNNWWTEKDRTEYAARQQAIVTYYNRYHLSDGAYANGANTLGENIADLGGLQCITQIVGNDPQKLRTLYTSYASLWKELGNDEFYRLIMENDVHSVSAVRIDAVLSSTDGFYTAFDVKPGDAMYVAPEDRAKLW